MSKDLKPTIELVNGKIIRIATPQIDDVQEVSVEDIKSQIERHYANQKHNQSLCDEANAIEQSYIDQKLKLLAEAEKIGVTTDTPVQVPLQDETIKH